MQVLERGRRVQRLGGQMQQERMGQGQMRLEQPVELYRTPGTLLVDLFPVVFLAFSRFVMAAQAAWVIAVLGGAAGLVVPVPMGGSVVGVVLVHFVVVAVAVAVAFAFAFAVAVGVGSARSPSPSQSPSRPRLRQRQEHLYPPPRLPRHLAGHL